MTKQKTFGELFRNFLNESGLSARYIANKLGVEPSTVTRWEREQSTPNSEKLVVSLINVLKINVEEADVLWQAYGTAKGKQLPHISTRNLEQVMRPTPRSIMIPTSVFTGRKDEIKRIIHHLKIVQFRQHPVVVAISGLGGIGKTELSKEIGWRARDLFLHRQILIPMQGMTATPRSPEDALRRIIYSFDPKLSLPDDLQTLMGIYQSLLEDKNLLIIADDALDAQQVEPLIPPPGNALLVTSRHFFVFAGHPSLELKGLSNKIAIELLQTLSPRLGAQANTLATLCDGLPLALSIHASVLSKHQSLNVEDYIQTLSKETSRLIKVSDPNHHNRTVELALAASYQQLDAQARTALQQLGVFEAAFDLNAASAIIIVNDSRVITLPSQTPIAAVLDILVGHSLLEWDQENTRYRIHDLVRIFALYHLSDPESVSLRYAQYYMKIMLSINETFLRGDLEESRQALVLFDQERTHIDSAGQWSIKSLNPTARSLVIDYARIMDSIGPYRYSIQHTRIPVLEAGITAAQDIGDGASEVFCLRSLGVAYADQGDHLRAMDYYQQARMINKEVNDQKEESRLRSYQGTSAYFLGDMSAAIDHHRRHLEITEAMMDFKSSAAAYNNLGICFYSQGELKEAQKYFFTAYELNHTYNDLAGEASALGNIGIIYHELKEFAQAIHYMSLQLSIVQKMGDKKSESRALGNIGTLYADQHMYEQAKSYYDQALPLTREAEDRQGEARTLHALGELLVKINDLEAAQQTFDDSLSIYQKLNNRDGVADARQGQALVLLKQGQIDLALSIYAEVLTAREGIHDLITLGYLHQEIADAYVLLPNVSMALIHYEKALKLYQEQDLMQKVTEVTLLIQSLGRTH